MNWRHSAWLFLLGLSCVSLVALFQHTPGYMDAEYYYAGGKRLVEGYGFTEIILWNYLDDARGLPHPSHTYWMPLASVLAALGMNLFSATSFWAARSAFLLLAAFIPVTTARLAYSISRRRDHALLAGYLSCLPGFYLSYLGTTDTFGIYMLLGTIWLQCVGWLWTPKSAQTLKKYLGPFCLGVIAGLMHLSRADGLIWLLLGLVVVGYRWLGPRRPWSSSNETAPAEGVTGISRVKWADPFLASAVLAAGYLVVAAPWLWRNWVVFHRIFPPGGERALWLTDYDELFSYPAAILTPARWWASGWKAILQERLYALGQNLQTALVVQGEIFLTPLVIWGLWHWRKDVSVSVGLAGWTMTLLVMSVLFPFAGWRGGFFHSGAAIQPLFWAVAPAGLEKFIRWGERVRHWDIRQAGAFFRAGIIGIAVLLSLLAVQKRVIGSSLREPLWDQPAMNYLRVESALRDYGAAVGDRVLVNNPPGYYLASGRTALVVPNGSEQTLLGVARRYGVRFLLLEHDHPRGLERLYRAPDTQAGLKYLFEVNGVRVFEFVR